MAKPYKVDEIDLEIIEILQQDGRRAYAEIANELQLAPSTVQQRANRLIDAGLVKITALVEPSAVGITVLAMLAIKVEGARLREAAAEISAFKKVNYVVICTGAYDILLEVACQSNDDLLTFISGKLARVAGIRDIETFLYLHPVKNSSYWNVTQKST